MSSQIVLFSCLCWAAVNINYILQVVLNALKTKCLDICTIPTCKKFKKVACEQALGVGVWEGGSGEGALPRELASRLSKKLTMENRPFYSWNTKKQVTHSNTNPAVCSTLLQTAGLVFTCVTCFFRVSFYSCLLSDPAYEWQRGCWWPCIDTDLAVLIT